MPKTIIRTSDRLNFKRCRRKWDLGSPLRQDLEPLAGAKPLEFGVAMHKGLEVYYDPHLWKADRDVVQNAAKATFFNCCNDQKKRYLKLQERVDLDIDVEAEFKERLELGLGMLDHYFDWAPDQDRFTPLKSEIEFEVQIPSTPNVYQGRVDLLLEDFHGDYWIMDHKTAGQFSSTDWLDMDEQCGSYIWALREQLDLPIAGVIYNRLLKAVPKKPEPLVRGGFSQNKQQRTTYDVYLKALQQAGEPIGKYIDFLDYLKDKGNPFFQRIPVHRTKTEAYNIADQIVDEQADMLDNPRIYPNPGLFTCMGCVYKQPCQAIMDGSDYQWILNQYYEKRTHDSELGSTD